MAGKEENQKPKAIQISEKAKIEIRNISNAVVEMQNQRNQFIRGLAVAMDIENSTFDLQKMEFVEVKKEGPKK